MKQYSLGIAFDFDENLVLIKKKHPDWQAGKYNFVGGKLEENENILDCMSREFYEETGVMVPSYGWKYVGKMSRENDFIVYIFVTVNEDVKNARTTTDEEVKLVTIDEFEHNSEIIINSITNLKTIFEFVKSEDFIDQQAELIIKYPPYKAITN